MLTPTPDTFVGALSMCQTLFWALMIITPFDPYSDPGRPCVSQWLSQLWKSSKSNEVIYYITGGLNQVQWLLSLWSWLSLFLLLLVEEGRAKTDTHVIRYERYFAAVWLYPSKPFKAKINTYTSTIYLWHLYQLVTTLKLEKLLGKCHCCYNDVWNVWECWLISEF